MPSYPKWYDLITRSQYHVGMIGHSTENSRPLNMVKAEEKQTIIDVNDVRTPTKMIFEVLAKINYIETISFRPGLQS